MDKRDGYYVKPERIVPLCSQAWLGRRVGCHQRYDPHTRGNAGPIDIWHLLTLEEQAQAIEDAGGFWLAVKRCAPVAYAAYKEAA